MTNSVAVVTGASQGIGRSTAVADIAGAVPQIDLFEIADEQRDCGLALKPHGARRLSESPILFRVSFSQRLRVLFGCDRVSRRGRNRTSSSLLKGSMPLIVLDLRQTAVHYNLAASREARFVRGEKQRSCRDLVRAPNPSQRGL